MDGSHQVRVVHAEDGYRAECTSCEWRSEWHATEDVAEFHAMRHADQSG